MAEGMDEWARGAAGRTVTWPAPDTYVLVEGVLLRMLPEAPATPRGTEVVVGLDETSGRLVARPADRDGAARG
ncbi:hypothetical protein ABZW30_38595 [Kitasatospora sp. NPDC004669]|uniref:hypothetical protein n=1 Tax=Kitasatospora sp. NPDC004669 TaxID=3154555 RepID=UPI0033B0D9D7